jgi:hypothetical protein
VEVSPPVNRVLPIGPGLQLVIEITSPPNRKTEMATRPGFGFDLLSKTIDQILQQHMVPITENAPHAAHEEAGGEGFSIVAHKQIQETKL